MFGGGGEREEEEEGFEEEEEEGEEEEGSYTGFQGFWGRRVGYLWATPPYGVSVYEGLSLFTRSLVAVVCDVM